MKKNIPQEYIKTDLKHDSMEFTASTDGDDKLDADDPAYEEAEIAVEELDALEDVSDSEAAALNAMETDMLADADIMPEEDWTDDLPDKNNEADENEQHRK